MKRHCLQLWKISRSILWLYALSVILTLLISVAAIYPAQVFREVYDNVLADGNVARLLTLATLVGLVYIAIQVATLVNNFIIVYANTHFHNKLRLSLFRMSLLAPYRELEHFGSGQLLGRFQADLGNIATWLSIVASTIASSIATFVTIGSFIYLLDYRLLIGVVLTIPFYVLVIAVFKKPIYQSATTVQYHNAQLLHRLEDLFRGARDIVLSTTIRPFEKWLNEAQEDAFRTTLRMNLVRSGSNAATNFLAVTGPLVMFVYGGYLVIKNQITVGTLIAFLAVINRLFQAINALFAVRLQQYALRASITRIEELLRPLPTICSAGDTPNTESDPVKDHAIVVDSVCVSYGDKEIMANVNFTVPAGATCLVVGSNGAGKSTLMEILAGLQLPSSGKVALGGRELSGIPQDELRSSISVVPQRPHIFDRTLLENLTYTNTSRSMSYLENAMEIAGLTDKHSRLAQGDIDSACGATGRIPSGGEAHRIALVRALMIRPKVMILDETFSSMPSNSEEDIIQRLREFNREMTIIVVSHRPVGIRNYTMKIDCDLTGRVQLL